MSIENKKEHGCSEDLPLQELLKNNQIWASFMSARDPDYFKKLAAQQSPKYLWIGCSDARVPANEMIILPPGEVFVHRNVANVVASNDLNSASVIQFAVDVLKVKHIIVVGHYGCAGVKLAIEDKSIGVADEWLQHVKNIYQKHKTNEKLFGSLKDIKDYQNRLVELNAIEQALHLCENNSIKNAWNKQQQLSIHSCVYGIDDGLLRDLGMTISMSDKDNMDAIYKNSVENLEKNTK